MTDKSSFYIEGRWEKQAVSQLVERLTAERAALLDRLTQITAARMEQLDLANLPADIASILAAIGGIAGGANWQPYGPRNVEVANDVTAGVTVYDPGGGIVPAADITPGTHDIERIRGAVLTPIVNGAASTAADGLVFANYNFPLADWDVGDLFVVTFEGISIDIGGTVTDLPPVQLYGRVVREPDIQSMVTDIDNNVGAEAGTTLHDKLTAARAALIDNLDAAISSRSAPGDEMALTAATLLAIQALILADATPFNGADIDAAVSSRAAPGDEMDLLAAAITAIRQSVTAAGDPANSIGKALYELYVNRLTADRAGYLDELAAANIPTDIDTLLTRLSDVRAGYLDELAAANIPTDIDTLLTRLSAPRAGYLDTLNTGVYIGSRTTAYGRLNGVTQIFNKNITSAANAGDVTVATITTQACLIKRVVLRSNGATTADLTSAAIYAGASKVVTIIDAASGARANIAAADQQVSWTGAVALDATKTVVITLAGTGATAVNLDVDIEYEAIADGGYLA
ncbi:hypothetical protein ACFLXC_04130 [Chloroflexota bacterium]